MCKCRCGGMGLGGKKKKKASLDTTRYDTAPLRTSRPSPFGLGRILLPYCTGILVPYSPLKTRCHRKFRKARPNAFVFLGRM